MIVHLTDAGFHFNAVQALPEKEIGMEFQTGVTKGDEGEAKGSSIDAKRPPGVYQPCGLLS